MIHSGNFSFSRFIFAIIFGLQLLHQFTLVATRDCNGLYLTRKNIIKYEAKSSSVQVDLEIARIYGFAHIWEIEKMQGTITLEYFTAPDGKAKVRYNLDLSNNASVQGTLQMAIFPGTPNNDPDVTMTVTVPARSTDGDCYVDDVSSISGKTMTMQIYYA